MAVQEGSAGADAYSDSPIDRARMMPGETFWRRLLMWGAAVALASLAVKQFLPATIGAPSLGVLMSLHVLAGIAGLGASAYCFARFTLGRELRYLLAAAAFSALSSGAILQAIADFRAPTPLAHGWLVTSAWLVASLFFVGSAFSQTTWRASGARDTVAQLAFGVLLAATFPLVAVWHAFDPNILYALSRASGGDLLRNLVDIAARALAPVLVTVALVGTYRRLRSVDDRAAALLCYFLLACTLGLISRAASAVRFDQWWAVSQVVAAASWIVLVVGIEVENAFTHREASERLGEQEFLHDVSWALVGAGTCRELLNLFVSTLVDKLGARMAAVYISDAKAANLELAAICGPEESVAAVGTQYPLISSDRRPGFHTGHTARAFASKEVRIASDVFVDVEFVPWQMIAADDGCAASLPLVDRGTAIGVLSIYFPQSRKVTPQRLKLLATIAAAATPAIQNARAGEEAGQATAQRDEIGLAA